jgi:hypothetical protein
MIFSRSSFTLGLVRHANRKTTGYGTEHGLGYLCHSEGALNNEASVGAGERTENVKLKKQDRSIAAGGTCISNSDVSNDDVGKLSAQSVRRKEGGKVKVDR